MVIVAAGVFAQLTYLLPNWLAVLLLVELVAAWDLLGELGVVELIETQVQSAEVSLTKFLDMIPRYKGE